MQAKKRIPIGIENYKEMIDKDYYYVDKTLMIKDLIDKGGKVNLFTRPRRFGKTLDISMIKTFFEDERDINGNKTDNSRYFKDKKICDSGINYMSYISSYPVINLSLKSAKQPDYHMSYKCLIEDIAREFERHRYVLDENIIMTKTLEKYKSIMNEEAETSDYATAIRFLSECLYKYHGKKAVILIDEYDVPLENSYFNDFYDEMTGFIRSLFESALKTNDYLEFAVITGCLRISKESIFTGLNNLEVISILNEDYAEYFGFTNEEIEEMLKYYHIESKAEEAKEWYDGYLFGETEVYNPWSMLNYVKASITEKQSYPKPYWSNTSSNSIVRELIENADMGMKKEIEKLIAGGTIEKPVHEDITYGDIHKTQDNLWNFLFFTGYLKMTGKRFETDTIYLTMSIPNAEIRYIYKNKVLEWFEGKLKNENQDKLYKAILDGDCESIEEQLSEKLLETISFYDYAESYYHGFMAGLLRGCQDYIVESNYESGNGRPDIIFKYPSSRGQAVIIELKVAKTYADMEKCCKEAIEQINEKNYDAELKRDGYKNIKKYGICFYKKECKVQQSKITNH